MAPVSCPPGAIRAKTRGKGRLRRQSSYSTSACCRWSRSGLTNFSAPLLVVNFARWSIKTIQSAASVGNAPFFVCPDSRSITCRYRCGNRRCKSWPGSILSTWRISVAETAGWLTIWPAKGFQSALIRCDTLCMVWSNGRSTRSHAPRFQKTRRSDFSVWWISGWSRLWIRSGLPASPTSRCRRVFSTWWRSWTCSPGMCTAGSSNSLDTEFCFDALEMALEGARTACHQDTPNQSTSGSQSSKCSVGSSIQPA